MLSHSTFHLEDLCKKKTALYIVTDDTTTTADSIVGIIISQIQTFWLKMLIQWRKIRYKIQFHYG